MAGLVGSMSDLAGMGGLGEVLARNGRGSSDEDLDEDDEGDDDDGEELTAEEIAELRAEAGLL